ncbi:tetratricopeptide repeat protein [Variovorax sp. LjRoot130]
MPNKPFSWLHLTDLHYGLKGQGHLWPTLRGPFLDSLASLHEKCGPWDAVLFTGDLVQGGKADEFTRMQAEVLEPLWRKLGDLGSSNAVLLAVPGNHDLFRPNPDDDDPAAERLLEEGGFQRIQQKFWDQPDGSYRRVINNAFAAYSGWWKGTQHRPDSIREGILPGDFSTTLQCGSRRIGIVGLNTAFLQLAGGDYKGRLVWDSRQVHALCEGGVDVWAKQHDVCLMLTHQGPDWLTPEARKDGESEIVPAGRFAVQLFGHQHELEIQYTRKGGGANPILLCQGCSVFGMDRYGEPPTIQRSHGYSAGRIEFDSEATTLRIWPRVATNKTGPWRFVPDHEHAELTDDGGTSPERVVAQKDTSSANRSPLKTDEDLADVPQLGSTKFVPHSTLPSRRPFFGRKPDLEKIAKCLSPEHRGWGVVLDGPGGVGKTSLALEAAHRAPAEHYPLKLWVTAKGRELLPNGLHTLTDHRVGDFHDVLNELALALGRDDIPRASPLDRPDLFRHALANHRALLVLDNLETFSPAERRRLFELLDSLPAGCRAIVTSRRRTDGSLASHVMRLDMLERDAADELLNELGQRWEPAARLTPAERDQLYSETGGNPLLLTWTVGQLGLTTGRCRTVAAAISRLQEAHRVQSLDQKNDPLDFIFGDLLETFSTSESAVLAALVHFTQPAKLDWLIPMTDLSSKAVETALDGLRDRSLLEEDEVAGTWMLPPLAALFLRRASPAAIAISGDRLASWAYAQVVQNGFQNYARFPVLEATWPQVAAALPVLVAGDTRRLQHVCAALNDFLDFTGRWDELLALESEAEAKAVLAQDFTNAGWRAFRVGYCHRARGEAVEVLACADRAAAHWKAARADPCTQALAFQLRGWGHELGGDYAAAVTAHRESIRMCRSLSPKSVRTANYILSLGIALMASDASEADTCFHEALAIATTSREPEAEHVVAICTANLAISALKREQWPEAEEIARRSLELAENVGRKVLIARSCLSLARALARQNRASEGRSYAERAVKMFTELRSPELGEAQVALAESRR